MSIHREHCGELKKLYLLDDDKSHCSSADQLFTDLPKRRTSVSPLTVYDIAQGAQSLYMMPNLQRVLFIKDRGELFFVWTLHTCWFTWAAAISLAVASGASQSTPKVLVPPINLIMGNARWLQQLVGSLAVLSIGGIVVPRKPSTPVNGTCFAQAVFVIAINLCSLVIVSLPFVFPVVDPFTFLVPPFYPLDAVLESRLRRRQVHSW